MLNITMLLGLSDVRWRLMKKVRHNAQRTRGIVLGRLRGICPEMTLRLGDQ